MIKLILHTFRVFDQLLDEFYVHPYHVVQNFNAHNRQAQKGLWHNPRGFFGAIQRVLGRFKLLGMGEQQSRDHIYDTEYLCVLNNEEIVLSDFIVSFVYRSVPGVTRCDRSNSFQKSNTFQKKHGNLPHHL